MKNRRSFIRARTGAVLLCAGRGRELQILFLRRLYAYRLSILIPFFFELIRSESSIR